MARDRNNNRITIGDPVRIIRGMAVVRGKTRFDRGTITAIDGAYISIKVVTDDVTVIVERYGSELWLDAAEKLRRLV